MNAGKVLIGTALLILSFAMMVTPSGAAQMDALSLVGGGDAFNTGDAGERPQACTPASDAGRSGNALSTTHQLSASCTGIPDCLTHPDTTCLNTSQPFACFLLGLNRGCIWEDKSSRPEGTDITCFCHADL